MQLIKTMNLTDEQLNVSICEWMGWKLATDISVKEGEPNPWKHPHCARWESSPPNFLSDDSPRRLLNEAEARLTHGQQGSYMAKLYNQTTAHEQGISPNQHWFACANASARQRAIAILKTVKPEIFQ